MNNLKQLADQIHGLDEVGGCELMEVEAQWLQQATNEMRQAADLIEQLQQRVVEFEKERDALAAHVERISEILRLANNTGWDIEESLEAVINIIYQSPQTSLAERDKKVLRDFVNGLLGDKEVNANQVAEFGNGLPTVYIRKVDILKYSDKRVNAEDGE